MTETKLIMTYLAAKARLITLGFGEEIDWQQERDISTVGESEFLKEFAWVVLSSGMREAVVRSKFNQISEAFYYWQNSHLISDNSSICLEKALQVFNHSSKMNAIVKACKIICKQGFANVRRRILHSGIEYIRTFPFMGPTTSFHLAKNLGIDVAKPDRHLVRISSMFGYATPNDLCKTIAEGVGDRVSVVDLVLWRYATLFPYRQLLLEAFV